MTQGVSSNGRRAQVQAKCRRLTSDEVSLVVSPATRSGR